MNANQNLRGALCDYGWMENAKAGSTTKTSSYNSSLDASEEGWERNMCRSGVQGRVFIFKIAQGLKASDKLLLKMDA